MLYGFNQYEWIQGGGEALGLEGKALAFAVAVNFVLGALRQRASDSMPLHGLGVCAGYVTQVAFPIMMGSCAFLCRLRL